MITRWHQGEGSVSRAVYSPCLRHRYLLGRVWAPGPALLWVMLNPSTATEVQNDPTIERCERRARMLGFGGVEIVNLFAFRATDPAAMKAEGAAAVGPGNDAVIAQAAAAAGQILCGWGLHGAHLGRGAAVEAMLRGQGRVLWHLGLTKGGHPRHPLYVGYAQGPVCWPD